MAARKKTTRKAASKRRYGDKSSAKKPRSEVPETGRPTGDTEDWAPAFLAALLDGLHVRDACDAARVNSSVAYRRRKDDEPFRQAWAEAQEIGTKELEAEAARRAYHGTQKPVYQGGELVGHVREYSDTLLMFLLRARKPKKYRENHKVEVDGRLPVEIVGIEVVTTHAPAAPITSTESPASGNPACP